MSTKRVKTIVIVVLLLVDIAFGFLLISDKVSEKRRAAQAADDLIAVMARNGIALAPDIIPGNSGLSVLKCERDIASEKKIASVLIGESAAQDLGGGLFAYETRNGTVRFRSNGEFESVLSSGCVRTDGDIVSASLDLLSSAGISVNPQYTLLDGETVAFTCSLNGTDIYGCTITLSYSLGSLVSVSGTRPTGAPGYRTADTIISVPTALMRFLSYISSGGYICTQIEGIDICYFMSVSASGLCTLQPVWQIDTDTGTFYINAVSGAFIST